MKNEFSRAELRREQARAHRLQVYNSRGEVECSECGAGVEESRGNRNAQELEREGVRKNKGPICNACQASWRYSHHQVSEVEMANAADTRRIDDLQERLIRDHWDELQEGLLKPVAATMVEELSRLTRLSVVAVIAQMRTGGLNEFNNESVSKDQKEVEDAASWMRSRKWKSEHDAIQAAIDEADFSSQAAAKAAGLVARSNPRAFENAKTGTCAECGDQNVKVVDVHVQGKGGPQQLCRKCWLKTEDNEPSSQSRENADLPAYCHTCGVSLSFKESHGHRDKGHDVGPAPDRKNAARSCPKCGKKLEVSEKSGGWGTFYECPEHGVISGPDIVYNSFPPEIKTRREKRIAAAATFKNADDNGFSDADVHAKAQEMFKDSWDNLSSRQQDQVYAALEKEMKNSKVKCSRCGAGLGPDGSLGVEHGPDTYCVDCAVEKGFIDKKDAE